MHRARLPFLLIGGGLLVGALLVMRAEGAWEGLKPGAVGCAFVWAASLGKRKRVADGPQVLRYRRMP